MEENKGDAGGEVEPSARTNLPSKKGRKRRGKKKEGDGKGVRGTQSPPPSTIVQDGKDGKERGIDGKGIQSPP